MMSKAAELMIQQLDAQDAALSDGELLENILPIRELSPMELAYTKFGENPAQTLIRQLPYLKPDKTQAGEWNRAYCLVHVYNDGTAIAISREWKYAYRADQMTLDGNPVKSPGVGKNDMTIKFYLIGCKHEYEEQSYNAKDYGVSLLSMDHLHVCKHCKHQFVVNTSD